MPVAGFNNHPQQQTLQYFCSYCGTLLKISYGSTSNPLLVNLSEECPTCGVLLSQTLKRELKSAEQQQRQQQQNNIQQSSSFLSSPPLPKFQTAYEEISSRLTFDIKKIDNSISITAGQTVCISGSERKYINILLVRLCVRALLPERKRYYGRGEGGFGSSSPKVIVIDAAGNSLDIFYLYVNFARQYYGLDIKKVLENTIITRAFTIYQLANIIIHKLPRVVQQFDVKLIVIFDLLDMFLRDPQIEIEEAEHIIKEIVNSIKRSRRREVFGNILFMVSLPSYSSNYQSHHHRHHQQLSAIYNKIILPRFDKHIEITSATNSDNNKNKNKINNSLLYVKIKNNNKYHSEYSSSSGNNLFPIEKRDLLIVSPSPER